MLCQISGTMADYRLPYKFLQIFVFGIMKFSLYPPFLLPRRGLNNVCQDRRYKCICWELVHYFCQLHDLHLPFDIKYGNR